VVGIIAVAVAAVGVAAVAGVAGVAVDEEVVEERATAAEAVCRTYLAEAEDRRNITSDA